MSEQVKHTLHWVQGNTVNFAIPLQQETQTPQGKVVEDYYPAVDDVVTVSMCGKYLSTQIPCTVDGNVVIANDNGTLKVDVYGVEIRIKKADGTNLRSMWDTQVQIHKTNDGVLTEWDDFVAPDSQSLDAAIFFFAKGDKGDKGDQGIQGEKGEQGERGEKGEKGDAGTTDYNELENKPDLSVYQEKEQGKGLSENDYTDEEKQLVHSAVQQESDPTVPQWAKQPNKPSYTSQEVGALPNSTKYGSTIDLAMNSTTYVLTLSLKDQDGTVLNTKTVDLPIESVVVNGRYDAANKKIVLTLQSGSTIDVPVGDLIAGLQTEITSVNMLDADLVDDTNSTHKFVTLQEKQAWNNKSDFSGSYNDLSDKPTIPTALSQLSEDATHRTVSDAEKTTWGNKQETLVSGTNIKTVNNTSLLGSGNIDTSEVFVATYGTTTFDEIDAAYAAGKAVIVNYTSSGKVYSGILSYVEGSPVLTYSFTQSYAARIRRFTINRQGVWSVSEYNMESTSNKVTSISQSSTDTQYPSANAVVNAIGKRGVISQTQTWASDWASYTMSNIVIGIIPQSAIDLYEEAGATFNENGYQEGVGYFEMNGITDLSYQNIKDAYNFSYHNNGQWTNYDTLPRTNFPLCNGIDFGGGVFTTNRDITLRLYYLNGNMEVLRLSRKLTGEYGASLQQSNYMFYFSSETLREVMGVMDIYYVSVGAYFFTYVPQLKTVKFRELRNNISLGRSPVLSLESVVYMVRNSANTSAITITLHADALARCTADTTEYEYNGNTYTGIVALATAKNITLAS